MKRVLFVLMISILAFEARSQDSLNNLSELKQLLKQRKDQFDTYAKQAGNRSGIFGNQTKKDLEKSREILLQIVSIDNQIMDELNRAITTRGMAKADYSADQLQYTNTIQQLTLAADTLEKQTITLKEANERNERNSTIEKIIIALLSVVTVLLLIRLFRRK